MSNTKTVNVTVVHFYGYLAEETITGYQLARFGRTWCRWHFDDGPSIWLRTKDIRKIDTSTALVS